MPASFCWITARNDPSGYIRRVNNSGIKYCYMGTFHALFLFFFLCLLLEGIIVGAGSEQKGIIGAIYKTEIKLIAISENIIISRSPVEVNSPILRFSSDRLQFLGGQLCGVDVHRICRPARQNRNSLLQERGQRRERHRFRDEGSPEFYCSCNPSIKCWGVSGILNDHLDELSFLDVNWFTKPCVFYPYVSSIFNLACFPTLVETFSREVRLLNHRLPLASIKERMNDNYADYQCAKYAGKNYIPLSSPSQEPFSPSCRGWSYAAFHLSFSL